MKSPMKTSLSFLALTLYPHLIQFFQIWRISWSTSGGAGSGRMREGDINIHSRRGDQSFSIQAFNRFPLTIASSINSTLGRF
jgi:hypothetical protein